jgi:exodeoxyribonuclease-5
MALARNGLHAKTIHSAIYNVEWRPYENDAGEVKFRREFILKNDLGPRVKAIVVDEGSMVPEQIATDLLSFGLPIIVLGDLNQLPPVMGNAFFLQSPDSILKKIMRQAEESPIIRLSQDILHSRMFRLGDYDATGKIHILEDKKGMEVDFSSFDSVIVGKNLTREMYNKYIREQVYGRFGDIQVGDKLICRKNNWDYFTHEGIFLINGLVGTVTDIDIENSTDSYLNIELLPEGYRECFHDVNLDRKMFKIPISKKRDMINMFSKYDLFEYAYAITCHLSQGSQYNNIYVKYEQMQSSEYCRKWLYTAVTRAIERMTLVI